MSCKRVYADWGCYKVFIDYDPADINKFEVFYNSPGFDWNKTKYRKLTKPEIRAALEAIYKNEEMKIMPLNSGNSGEVGQFTKYGPENKQIPSAGPTPIRGWRDQLALRAMEKLLEGLPSYTLSKLQRKQIAADSYLMADAMMEAREPKIEICKHCKQTINQNHGC